MSKKINWYKGKGHFWITFFGVGFVIKDSRFHDITLFEKYDKLSFFIGRYYVELIDDNE